MKNQLLAPFLGLLLLCLPLSRAAAQDNLIDMVCFETNFGEFCVRLFPEDAPQTVANFLSYVEDGFYDGTIFHRHDGGFVLQGGGYASPVAPSDVPPHKQTEAPIPLEIKVSNVQGTVAMARTSTPNSATSEFFINLVNNDFLDFSSGGYAAFGYITDMTLVSAMRQAPCVNSNVTQGNALGDV